MRSPNGLLYSCGVLYGLAKVSQEGATGEADFKQQNLNIKLTTLQPLNTTLMEGSFC